MNLKCIFCVTRDNDQLTVADVILDGMSLCLAHAEVHLQEKEALAEQERKRRLEKKRTITIDPSTMPTRTLPPAVSPPPSSIPRPSAPALPSRWKARSFTTSGPFVPGGIITHHTPPAPTGVRATFTWEEDAPASSPLDDILEMARRMGLDPDNKYRSSTRR